MTLCDLPKPDTPALTGGVLRLWGHYNTITPLLGRILALEILSDCHIDHAVTSWPKRMYVAMQVEAINNIRIKAHVGLTQIFPGFWLRADRHTFHLRCESKSSLACFWRSGYRVE